VGVERGPGMLAPPSKTFRPDSPASIPGGRRPKNASAPGKNKQPESLNHKGHQGATKKKQAGRRFTLIHPDKHFFFQIWRSPVPAPAPACRGCRGSVAILFAFLRASAPPWWVLLFRFSRLVSNFRGLPEWTRPLVAFLFLPALRRNLFCPGTQSLHI
jgi:hypothetical protein